MLKILISLITGLIITGMTMTGSKSLSIDTFLNGIKAFNHEQFNDQSNQVVPKVETTPEEKKQIEAIKKIRNDMMISQQKLKNEKAKNSPRNEDGKIQRSEME
ncbi:hypothetical protein [Methylobacter sp.]|uniref:hypothetical protein n=1 Tax=Methylobacter sp. TaxID=2051955 RepID=UPI0024871B34|nr:hypothetical protein [Methylobacter sp.]MDI1279522.1 hypothetical protein [Methylobacter sp.]MDI1360271.1 hypothetical protein [Methylobacter sp.]